MLTRRGWGLPGGWPCLSRPGCGTGVCSLCDYIITRDALDLGSCLSITIEKQHRRLSVMSSQDTAGSAQPPAPRGPLSDVPWQSPPPGCTFVLQLLLDSNGRPRLLMPCLDGHWSLPLSQKPSLTLHGALTACFHVLSITDRGRGFTRHTVGNGSCRVGPRAWLAWGGPTWLLTLHGALLAGQAA